MYAIRSYYDTLRVGDELSRKSVMFHVGRPNENGFTGKVWQTLGTDAFNSHTNICSSGGRTPTIQWANDDRTSPDWANAKLVFLNSSHAVITSYSIHYTKLYEMEQSGGATGIRTLETISSLHTFQACAFDHSATSPYQQRTL